MTFFFITKIYNFYNLNWKEHFDILFQNDLYAQMIIYVDVIFLENFIMNLLIIVSETIVLKSFNNYLKKIIATFIVSLFDCISLFCSKNFFIQILVSYIMVKIAFKPSNIKITIKEILLFYFISFLFGGVSFALLNFFESKITIINGIVFGNFLLVKLTFAAIISFVIVCIVLKEKKRHIYKDIVISYRGEKAKLKVLLDTGNLLKDPYSGKNVVIVEKDSIKTLFDENFFDDFENFLSGKKDMPIGIFVIPYRSLGNANDFLLGFKPDSICIKDETNKCIHDSVIGVCKERLSENKLYSGIFGLESFEDGV